VKKGNIMQKKRLAGQLLACCFLALLSVVYIRRLRPVCKIAECPAARDFFAEQGKKSQEYFVNYKIKKRGKPENIRTF